MTGDLTVRDVTKSVTFDTTVTPDSATQISGTAKVTVNRSDFNLTIPTVPSATNVTDDVQLEIDLWRRRASQAGIRWGVRWNAR